MGKVYRASPEAARCAPPGSLRYGQRTTQSCAARQRSAVRGRGRGRAERGGAEVVARGPSFAKAA